MAVNAGVGLFGTSISITGADMPAFYGDFFGVVCAWDFPEQLYRVSVLWGRKTQVYFALIKSEKVLY